MTWTRLDDTWTDKPQLEDLDFATRWHYLAMVQFCCRNERTTGVIRNIDARRASDHPDPARALSELVTAGLLVIEGNAYRVVEIGQHMPPPYIIKQSERARVRKQRERAHKLGDHSLCLPENCPESVTRDKSVTVTRDKGGDIGSGRDGTGQADTTGGSDNVISWPTVVPGKPGESA